LKGTVAIVERHNSHRRPSHPFGFVKRLVHQLKDGRIRGLVATFFDVSRDEHEDATDVEVRTDNQNPFEAVAQVFGEVQLAMKKMRSSEDLTEVE
jgi:hypothetical protein